MLFSAYKQSHAFIEVDSAPDHHTNVENLMAASNLVEFLWEKPLGESQDVDESPSNVERSPFKPRPSVRSCIDVSLVPIGI